MRLDNVIAQIHAVRDMLAEDDDERLLLDTIEGETDAYEVISRLLNSLEREEGMREALTAQMKTREARRDRIDNRIEAHRRAVAAVMGAIGKDKLTLPEATVSARLVAAKLFIADRDAVPDDMCEMKPTPSMAKIKAVYSSPTGALPNWLGVEPSRQSITVRRK